MLPAATVSRFPKPEFSSGYQIPGMNLDAPWLHLLTLQVLLTLLALALAGLALYRWRSRRLLLLIAIANALVFGFLLQACPCPIGLTQTLAEALFIPGNGASLPAFLLVALPLLTALYFGRLFCQGACPLGALQELLQWRALRVPERWEFCLRFLPYPILALGLAAAASGAGYFFCRHDPLVPIYRLTGALSAWGVTATLLAINLFVTRPFCRYLCPYGVMLRIASLFPSRQVPLTLGECINCRLCQDACPVHAIQAPIPLAQAGNYERSRQRWQNLLCLLPFLILTGALCGYAAAGPLRRLHPDHRLLQALQRGEDTLETAAFLNRNGNITALQTQNGHDSLRLRYQTALICAAVSLLAGLELLWRLKRRPESGFSVNSADCIACGRCLQACPLPPPPAPNEPPRTGRPLPPS